MQLDRELLDQVGPELVLRVNELYHDLEGMRYERRHSHWLTRDRDRFRALAIAHLPPSRPIDCLDYGSGTGFVALSIGSALKRADTLRCVDLSSELLKVCERRVTEADFACEVSFLKSDGEAIPVGDDSVDVLLVNSVLHHLHDLERFGTECERVIRPGGILIASHEPNGDRRASTFVRWLSLFAQTLFRPSVWIHKTVERSPWLERLLRRVLSVISAGYRQRNRMLREIAARLRTEGLVGRDLRGVEIQQLVDIQTQEGLRREHLTAKVFEGFEVVEWRTYDHLSEATGRNLLSRSLGRWMECRWPLAGYLMDFVLERRRMPEG